MSKQRYFVFGILILLCMPSSAQEPTTEQLLIQGQYSRVIQRISRIPPEQRNAEQWVNLAKSYHLQSQYEVALMTLAQVPVHAQQELNVVLLRIDILYAQGQWQRSANQLEVAAKQHAMHPDYILRFAQVQHALGNTERAEAAFNYYGIIRAGRDSGAKR